MARKYYGNIETISGTSYQVEIWDDPSGLATGGTELNLANEGLSFAYDGNGNTLWDGNMQSSRATAQFIVTETVDHTFFQDLAVEYENKAALIIYKDNVLHYVGRILPDQMQYERRPELNTIYTIVGVDGIALLDNYKVDYNWFNSTTERLSILQLIRQSIQETNLHAYYDHLGYADEFLIDASLQFPSGATAPNEYLNYLEINWASSLSDLESYMNLNSTEGSPRLYKKTSDIIGELLRTLGCRLIYSNGYFWIYDPIMLANNTGTNYIKYATDGSRVSKEAYTIQMAVDDGQRPCFAAFPIRSHQPPVRYISQTFDRVSFNRVIREFSNQSTSVLELRTPSIGWVSGEERSLFVRSQIKFAAQSFTGTPPMQTFSEINFRIYVDIGFGTNPYLVYDYQTQTWTPAATKPFFEKVRCDVADAEVVNSRITIFTIDFDREFEPPNYEDEVVIEISVGNLQWNFTSGSITNAVQFWGSLYMVERDQTQRSITATNTKNTGAAEVVELDSTYGYNFTGYSLKGVGTIWNSNTGGASQISMGDWAENQLAVYVEAPLLMTGQLVDAGNYFPTKIAYLDSDAFIFNGGTFNAQSETWDLELLKIAQDVTSVTLSYDDYVDYIDLNDQQGDSLRRSLLQTNQLRESVSNIPNWMQYDIIRLSPNSPTSTPSQSTDFNVKINYNPTDNILSWDIQELGKSDTVTSDETVTDTSVQIFDVDTALGSINLTLPTPSDVKGREYIVKKSHPLNTVTVTGTIDGSGSYLLDYENESVVLVSNGLEYVVKSEYGKDDLTDVTNRNNTTDNTVGVGALQLDLTPTATPTAGMLYWDEDEETAAIQVNGINYEIGQGLYWVAKNQTGVSIPKGTAVYASGTLGSSGRILISPMIANGTIEAKYFLGITAEDIANGDDGKVITQGKVRQIDTSGYTVGSVLWVSSSTAGALTSTQPSGSNLALAVAFVVESASNGVMAVRVSVLDENAIGVTPTLNAVTTAGNTTTNDIEVGGLNVDSGTLYVDSTNNRVGIGTSSPSELLSVATDTDVSAEIGRAHVGWVGHNDYAGFSHVDANSTLSYALLQDSAGQTYLNSKTGYPINFRINNSDKMRLFSNGNFAIGTTTDLGYKLRVDGSALFTNWVRVNGDDGIYFQDRGGGWRMTDTTWLRSYNDKSIYTGGGAYFGGNVGIGTTSPTSKTHVYYGGGTTNGLHVQASANRGKIAVSDNDTAAYMIAENSLASFGRQDALSSNNLNITNGGNVLIGTTTDNGYKLQVNGDATINGVRVGRGAGNVDGNTVLGSGAFNSNSTGLQNTAIGYQSLRNNTGQYNVALGYQSGYNNTTGERNTAIGRHSLYSNSTGSYNTSLGMNSLTSSTASFNTALGYGTLFNATTATNNTAVGVNALTNTTSSNNTAIGSSAAQSNTTGSIVAVGYQAGLTSNTSVGVTAIGFQALKNGQSSLSTAVGHHAALSTTSGKVTALGYYAAGSLTTGSEVTAIGQEALRNYTGSESTALGHQAGYSMTTPSYNTVIGRAAAYSTTTGHSNTAIGRSALYNNVTGSKNTAIGINSLVNTTNIENVAIGSYAGDANTTGSNNIFIGHNSDGVSATDSNRTFIGNSSTTSTWVGGNLLVGTTTDAGTWKTRIQGQYPLQLLNSSGTAKFEFYADSNEHRYLNGAKIIGRNQDLSIDTNSSSYDILLAQSGGSVGIGTSSPSANLHIAGGVTILGQNKIDGSSDNLKIMSDYANVSGNSTIEFSVDNSEKMRITNGGNVGIGTTSIYGKMHVSDSATGAAGMTVHNNLEASGNSAAIWFKVAGSTSDYRKGALLFVNDGTGYGRGDFYFASNTSTASTSIASTSDAKMVIKGVTGNVGIGTSSPATLLHSNNGSTSPNSFRIENSDGYGQITTDSNVLTYDAQQHLFNNRARSSEYMRINASGNVGISNTSPNYKLDVTGDINATSNYYHNGVQGYTGTVTIQQTAPNPPINIDINGGIITNVY